MDAYIVYNPPLVTGIEIIMADCSIQRSGWLFTITALFILMFVVQGRPIVSHSVKARFLDRETNLIEHKFKCVAYFIHSHSSISRLVLLSRVVSATSLLSVLPPPECSFLSTSH